MPTNNVTPFTLYDARVTFRNFSGAEKKNNRAGCRNFGVAITDEEFAKQLIDQGWNLKFYEPGNYYSLPVAVSFENYAPDVFIVNRNEKTKKRLNEKTIKTLDRANFMCLHMTVRPNCWTVNGKEGVKAYLADMYVELSGGSSSEYSDYREIGDDCAAHEVVPPSDNYEPW